LSVYLPTIVILLLLLSATAVAFSIMMSNATTNARNAFEDEVSKFEALLVEAMRSYEQVLRAGASTVNILPSITQEQWKTFVRDATADEFYPGIQGIGYVKRLARAEIGPFVETQRREGRPDYRFSPEGDREFYTAILYLEPDDWRNRGALGYDMFSEPRRRAAMEAARDSGQPRLSSKVTLVQETSEDIQPGALMFVPIYADGVVPAAIDARRMALQGYVYGAFRMKDFVTRVLRANAPGIFQRLQVSIYDGAGTQDANLLFDDRMLVNGAMPPRSPVEHTPRFAHQRTVTVAGTEWTIAASSKPAIETAVDRSTAWLVLIGGGLMSFLIAGIFASLAYAGERLARAERALSAEVAERKSAEERAQIANRELIHRVKNMLAIVSAIASQTARYSPTVSAFNTSFRERLTGLARVHDLLRPDPAHAPDLGTFIREILGPYCANRPAALATSGPRIELAQQEAVLLSLLINELATNAIKYGAWSVPAGQVALTWHQTDGGESGPEVEIVWQENGGPPVERPSNSGFGTNVMKFAIEKGLRGRITTSFAVEGIRHEVSLPRSGAPSSDGQSAFEEEG
jgi:CHASE1-domain containing sensor protein/two-component sensor histidine kinase